MWRSKLPANKIGQYMVVLNHPGACISCDTLASPDPGLSAQLKGTPTHQRCKYFTVFVDQFSDLTFVHLQKISNADETLEAKHAFERYGKSHGICIQHYHADNGQFAETKWLADLLLPNKQQIMSFCGVNAHFFQNGVAERCIQNLQDHT
jgi:hypothetical protein